MRWGGVWWGGLRWGERGCHIHAEHLTSSHEYILLLPPHDRLALLGVALGDGGGFRDQLLPCSGMKAYVYPWRWQGRQRIVVVHRRTLHRPFSEAKRQNLA